MWLGSTLPHTTDSTVPDTLRCSAPAIVHTLLVGAGRSGNGSVFF